MSEPFGLTARRRADGTWEVHLPHQCDTWDIAGEGEWEGVDHATAVAELERFAAEVGAALDALRVGREVRPA